MIFLFIAKYTILHHFYTIFTPFSAGGGFWTSASAPVQPSSCISVRNHPTGCGTPLGVIERSLASLERAQLPNLHQSYTILHHFGEISKKKANFLENGSYNLLQILFPTGPNHELSGTPRGFAPKIFLAELWWPKDGP